MYCMYQCSNCGYTTDSERGLAIHKGHGCRRKMIECDGCGENFSRVVSMIKETSNYCSINCPGRGLKTLECDICNTEFERYESAIIEGGTYCSNDCMGKGISTAEERNCDSCGKSINVRPHRLDRNENHYCSEGCMREGSKTSSIVKCSNCGSEHERIQYDLETCNNLYCSISCKHEYERGENHPTWKGGKCIPYGESWSVERKKRIDSDGYECVVCGLSIDESVEKFGRSLDVHHIVPRRYFYEHDDLEVDDANHQANLVTLCIPHHKQAECGQIMF